MVVTNLQCKLPVYELGRNGSGAFITFPGGTATLDRASAVYAPGSAMGGDYPGDFYGLTYNSALKRWLPVPYAWVKPDGSLYVYAVDFVQHTGTNPLTEVNALSGSSGILQPLAPINGAWQVIAVTTDYVYAINPQHPGLYSVPLLGPWNNENYVSDGFWTAASGSFAFGSATPDGGAIFRTNVGSQTIVASGARGEPQRQDWFNQSSSAVILGFDGAGSPVIWTGTDLWIASAPNQATRIGSHPPLDPPARPYQEPPIYGALAPVSDAHGLWLSTKDGIYLYTGGQMTKVSNLVAEVAGPCV